MKSKTLNRYGLIVELDHLSCGVSYYYNICKEDIILFKIRISDHQLNPHNSIPAGVIDDYSFSKLTVSLVLMYYKEYKSMTNDEIDEMWTNRKITA